MTPLVAGIALTGKAPVYENVYMSGLKQKAAGEAAAAKQRAKAEEDIEKSINIDYSKYHYSMQKLVKEKAAKAVSEMRNAIAEDNVRGINRANDIKRELLIDLAGIANTSNQLFEREKPTYTSTYIRPEVTFRELNSKDIRDVVKEPAVQQELEDYGMQINVDSEGRVSINFSDIKSFDVRKDYNTFQADIIDQFAPQLAESFRAGSTTRQELSQVITKQRSDDYLDAISSNPIGGRSAIFNWKKKYDIDITTPQGKQKVYEMFVAPERTGISSTAATGRGRGGIQETFEVLDGANSPKIDVNFGGTKTMSSEKAIPFPQVNVSVNYRGAFKIGEQLNYSKLSGDIRRETDNFQVKDIRSVKSWTGKKIEIPKGDYDGINFNTDVVLEQGMPLPDDVRNVLPKYIDRLKDDALQTIFGSTDRAALKAKIVNRDWIVGSGLNQEGKAKSETIFVPATKENLLQLEKSSSLSSNKYYKIRQHLKKAVEDPTILYKLNILGAATKGAETQPKSGFNLFNFA